MIKDLLIEGFVLKSNGYYKHAIEAFYKALEYDNASSELLLEIADTYFLMGEEERSLNYIEQILEKTPTHIGALSLLYKIFLQKGALNQAKQTAKNIYLISNEEKHLLEILKILNMQSEYDEVLQLSQNFNSSEIKYEKAFANLFLNNVKEALNEIEQAIDSDKNNVKYKLLKGKILFKSKKIDECLDIINSVSIKDMNSDFLNFAGLVEQQNQNYRTALAYFLEALKTESHNAEYHYNCASTYFKMNEIQLAKKYYNNAISIEPTNPVYHLALANLYYSQKNYKRALEELDFDLPESKILKAVILYDSGYVAIAKKELDSLNFQIPNDSIIKEYLDRINNELKIN